jgi:hypothetical protein
VHATLRADGDPARDALVAQRPQLEAALGRQNLRLEGFTVDLGNAGQQPGQGGQPDARPTTPHAGPAARPSTVATSSHVAPEPVAPPTGALSLRA